MTQIIDERALQFPNPNLLGFTPHTFDLTGESEIPKYTGNVLIYVDYQDKLYSVWADLSLRSKKTQNLPIPAPSIPIPEEYKNAIKICRNVIDGLAREGMDYTNLAKHYVNFDPISKIDLSNHFDIGKLSQNYVNQMKQLKISKEDTNIKGIVNKLEEKLRDRENYRSFLQQDLQTNIRGQQRYIQKIFRKCGKCNMNDQSVMRVKLTCGHILCEDCFSNKLHDKNPLVVHGELQFKCLMPSCFKMLIDSELEDLLKQGDMGFLINIPDNVHAKHNAYLAPTTQEQCLICTAMGDQSVEIKILHHKLYPGGGNFSIKHSVCRRCLFDYISFQTHNRLVEIDFDKAVNLKYDVKNCVLPIKCPFKDCNWVMGYDFLKDFLGEDIFIRQINSMYNYYEIEPFWKDDPEDIGVNGTIEEEKKEQTPVAMIIAKCKLCDSDQNLSMRMPSCKNSCRLFWCKNCSKEMGRKLMSYNCKRFVLKYYN